MKYLAFLTIVAVLTLTGCQNMTPAQQANADKAVAVGLNLATTAGEIALSKYADGKTIRTFPSVRIWHWHWPWAKDKAPAATPLPTAPARNLPWLVSR